MEALALPAVSPDLNERERDCVREVLRTAKVAYVAMVDASGRDGSPQPYVVPMNFAYELPAAGAQEAPCGAGPEGRILLHTGPGRKVDALAENPWVCVSIVAQEQLEIGPTPCQDGYLYQSVVLEGRVLLLTDEVEREAALRAIVAKYDPEAAQKPFEARIFAQTLLYAVAVDQIAFKERPRR